jgi:tripeptidyl-peptidase-2
MLRHDSQELLERLSHMPLVIARKLEPALTVPVYTCKRDAVVAGGTELKSEFQLRSGDGAALFVGPLPDDKLPKDATPGRTLVGSMTVGLLHKGGSGAAPTMLPFTFVVPPAPVKKDEKKEDGAKVRVSVTFGFLRFLSVTFTMI